MTKEIKIRLTKPANGWPKGAELGVPSKAVADDLYPDHKVISYVNGDEYHAPTAAKAEAAPAKAEAPTGKDA